MKRSSLGLDKLSFIHIPKTAGLSLNSELEKYFGAENSLRVGNNEARTAFLSMAPEQLNNYKYVTGHISIKELHEKGINYPAISVLREPVRRLSSLQQYLTNSDREEHQGVEFNDIEMLLENMFLEKKFNMQCWHLSGDHSFEIAVDSIKKNNILAVPLEYYQDLIDTLSDLLAAPLSNISINVTRYKEVGDVVDLSHHMLEPVIGDDLKLFSYVKQNYENIKHNFIKSLVR